MSGIDGVIHTADKEDVERLRATVRRGLLDFSNAILKDDKGNRTTMAPLHVSWVAHIEYAWSKGKGALINAPMGHAKCVRATTYVQMLDGSRKQIRHVTPGDKVVAFDATHRLVPDVVVASVATGTKATLRISAHRNHEIEVTPEHRLRTFDGWKCARDIVVGDYLAVPRWLPSGESYLDPEDAQILAAWIANGDKTADSFGFTIFSAPVVFELQQAAATHPWVWSKRKTDGRYALTRGDSASDTPLNFLRKHGVWGRTSNTVSVPEAVMRAPIDTVRAFLGMLWACDGSVCQSAQVFNYTSNSEQLVRDVRRLLWRLSIRSTVEQRWTKNQSGKVFPSWCLSVSDRTSMESFAANVTLLGKEDQVLRVMRKVEARGKTHSKSEVLPGSWRKHLCRSTTWHRKQHGGRLLEGKSCSGNTHRDIVAKFAREEKNEALYRIATGDVDWVRVEEIEDAGYQETHDIETAQHHSFLADDIVSHNSSYIGVGLPLYELSQDTNSRIKIISAGEDLAGDRVAGVRNYIDNDADFRLACPHVRASGADRENSTRKTAWARKKLFIHRSGMSTDASIEAKGIETMGAGGRADLMIFDDPVDLKNSRTAALRKKIKENYEKTWMTRLVAAARWVMISTPYHHEDLNADLRKNRDVITLEQAISADYSRIDFSVFNADVDHPLFALAL